MFIKLTKQVSGAQKIPVLINLLVVAEITEREGGYPQINFQGGVPFDVKEKFTTIMKKIKALNSS